MIEFRCTGSRVWQPLTGMDTAYTRAIRTLLSGKQVLRVTVANSDDGDVVEWTYRKG